MRGRHLRTKAYRTLELGKRLIILTNPHQCLGEPKMVFAIIWIGTQRVFVVRNGRVELRLIAQHVAESVVSFGKLWIELQRELVFACRRLEVALLRQSRCVFPMEITASRQGRRNPRASID